jgi:hypothetical protein
LETRSESSGAADALAEPRALTSPRTGTPHRAWLVAGLCACLAIGIAHVLYYWPEVIDDAFIIFRYARNFVRGDGLSFNPGGARVEGFSTVAWFWVSALAIKLGIKDVLTAVKVVGLVLYAGTIVAVWALAGGLDRRARATTLIAPLLVATNPFLAYHAVAGLETPLHVGMIVCAALAILGLRSHPRVAFPALVLSLALLPWTRPESFGYIGPLLLAAEIHYRDDRAPRRLVLRAMWVVAISIAVLVAQRWLIFGDVLPNTVHAKSAGPSGQETWAGGARYVGHFFDALLVPADVAIYLLLIASLVVSFRTLDLVLLAPVVCSIVFSIAVRGDWMFSYRFLLPAAPFVAALVARAATRALDRWPWRGLTLVRRVVVVAIAGLLGMWIVQQSLVRTERSGEDSFGRNWKPLLWPTRIAAGIHEGFPARLAGVTRWSIEHLAPSRVIATGDIGFPAWTSNARIVDLAGLTDKDLARIVPARDLPAYARALARRDPDVIVLRVSGTRPDALYDRLTAQSGVLRHYVLADSVETYGEGALALIYRRSDVSLVNAPDSVLARYDDAIAWSPRVHVLERWRDEYAKRHGVR